MRFFATQYRRLTVDSAWTVIGSLIGVGFASGADITWEWTGGSVSQVAASWGIAPAIACVFGFIIMMVVRLSVLDRSNPLRMGFILLPLYYGFTAAVFSMFIIVEGSHGIPSLDELGAGRVVGIVLGIFFGISILSAIFFVPYFWRKLEKDDGRLRPWHIPLGPLLLRDNPPLYWPGDPEKALVNYYGDDDASMEARRNVEQDAKFKGQHQKDIFEEDGNSGSDGNSGNKGVPADSTAAGPKLSPLAALERKYATHSQLPWYSPKRWGSKIKYLVLAPVLQDVHAHQSKGMSSTLDRAVRFDNKVEALWTTAQVLSSALMSVAHGANDVSNAIGPFTTEYVTWRNSGVISARQDTPIWIPAVGGIGIAIGFWTYGFRIIRSLGNKITQMSPTRGYAAEFAAAITVLLASRLGLPVSTTQCITGGIIGVALANWNVRCINWKQLGWIFLGWVLTLPIAGLFGGLSMLLFLNTPHFGVSQSIGV